jgi:hypothetical protein
MRNSGNTQREFCAAGISTDVAGIPRTPLPVQPMQAPQLIPEQTLEPQLPSCARSLEQRREGVHGEIRIVTSIDSAAFAPTQGKVILVNERQEPCGWQPGRTFIHG